MVLLIIFIYYHIHSLNFSLRLFNREILKNLGLALLISFGFFAFNSCLNLTDLNVVLSKTSTFMFIPTQPWHQYSVLQKEVLGLL